MFYHLLMSSAGKQSDLKALSTEPVPLQASPLTMEAIDRLIKDEVNGGNENFFREAMEAAGEQYEKYLAVGRKFERANGVIRTHNAEIEAQVQRVDEVRLEERREAWNQTIDNPRERLQQLEGSNTMAAAMRLLIEDEAKLLNAISFLPTGHRSVKAILRKLMPGDEGLIKKLKTITVESPHIEQEFHQLFSFFISAFDKVNLSPGSGGECEWFSGGDNKLLLLPPLPLSLNDLLQFSQTKLGGLSDPEKPHKVDQFVRWMISGLNGGDEDISSPEELYEHLYKLYECYRVDNSADAKVQALREGKKSEIDKRTIDTEQGKALKLNWPELSKYTFVRREFLAAHRQAYEQDKKIEKTLKDNLGGGAIDSGYLKLCALREKAKGVFSRFNMSGWQTRELRDLEREFAVKPDKYAQMLFDLYGMAVYFHTIGHTLREKGATEVQRQQGLETMLFAVGMTTVLDRMVAMLETRLAVASVTSFEMDEFTQFAAAMDALARNPLSLQVKAIIGENIERFRAALEVERAE
ncbi:hypothetical protein IPG41_03880 [Candidatus Peregrinibacteria bacterium]|nr:MAG: hypothetical protein IPG41_03880 [Candidatus Peregrinibacteria bacterium]